MKTLKNKYLIIAILICISFTGLSLYCFYPGEGIGGMLFFITVVAHYSFLILGPILFVFRISGFLRRENFFYILIGAANLWLSALSYLLYFTGKAIELMIWEFLPNLLVGILLLVDIYWVRTPRGNPKSR
jgi:NADH:ubiquinone oxidoreductase subunit K